MCPITIRKPNLWLKFKKWSLAWAKAKHENKKWEMIFGTPVSVMHLVLHSFLHWECEIFKILILAPTFSTSRSYSEAEQPRDNSHPVKLTRQIYSCRFAPKAHKLSKHDNRVWTLKINAYRILNFLGATMFFIVAQIWTKFWIF